MAKIRNNDSRAHVLPQRPRGVRKPGVNYLGPLRVEAGATVEVPDDYLAEILDVRALENAFAEGTLQAVEEPRRRSGSSGPPAEPPKSLSGIKVDDARPLIAAVTDPDVLLGWADDERSSIRDAIDARLEELSKES